MIPGLYWPVLHRFRLYVESLPDGIVAADAGAAVGPFELFFPLADSPAAPPGAPPGSPDPEGRADVDTTVQTVGEVRFGGHGGLLLVPIKDIWVTRTEDRVSVTIGYPWQFDGEDPRLELATGTLAWQRSPSGIEVTGRDLRITHDGSELFNGVYPVGGPLDDLRLHLPCGAVPAPDGVS